MQRPRSRVHLGPWFPPSLARSQARCSTFIIRTNFRSSWADHGANATAAKEGRERGEVAELRRRGGPLYDSSAQSLIGAPPQ